MSNVATIDDLELSVRAFEVVQGSGIKSIGELLEADVTGWSPHVLAEIKEALAAQEIVWDVEVPALPPFAPPPDRAVPRSTITLTEGVSNEPISRFGGQPNAPTLSSAWPGSMKFLFQLTGEDLGLQGVVLVQAFANMGGEYYDDNHVIVYRTACPALIAPPNGVESDPVRLVTLRGDSDDRILTDIDIYDDEAVEASGVDPDSIDRARRHAWADKIRGIPVGANLEREQRDKTGKLMTCLLQLVTYDEWFLWYLFANDDASELRLHVVRG